MLKKSNKITALLVMAASIISIVPAMAADRLGTKNGTIENAIAFKDGKYLYEGYRTDDDDMAIYYNAGDKDKKLDDATTFSTNAKFDNKYAMVEDGSDQYVVDLSSGKITDEDTATDLLDTAKTKLTTKLNKTSRYNKAAQAVSLNKIDAGKFADVWYEYTATTGSAVTYTGYTNASGTYIDCSYNANAYFYSASTQRMVKVENFGDTNDGVTLSYPTNVRTLGQDDKYIYRLVDVNVTGALSTDKNYAPLTNVTLLQKLAKTQGDKKDDAYLPKSTDSFIVSSTTGNSDATDAATVLAKVGTIFNGKDVKVTIVDGAIYVTYQSDTHKVKTEKLLLRTSEKVDKYTAINTKDTSKSKLDVHLAKKDGDKDTDADDWSIDVNGNVWAIYEGKIKESTKIGDFKTIYTCDRSFDKLDVYDENDLIAWENDGDAYTTVQEGKKQSQDDAGAIVKPTLPKMGWDKLPDGTWNFYDATGTKIVNKWINDGGTWYFLKSDGVMATGWLNQNGTWYYLASSGAMKTGWINDNGTWYYLASSGAMKTGWLNDNGTWYYLASSGAMLANTTVDGYILSASGAWIG
ncbi:MULTISPECIES: N-acetylmuramoyl-L-alanine amidase family protein [unclassified Clostridium]|uniref:N-acetylmuramoyl-L-alanine amidase family protein n=1 Tax=unclassified Clostridium TaxID=2614128 RepID=UPI0002985038|nr:MULTISPECIES: N-acetylmuramoyl-L-alanine amidase family protein [unclassified Clostridium]EKQ57722.1 MAG: putative cell wall binding protein [Clostridium sp. Maddingley MBC34-26]